MRTLLLSLLLLVVAAGPVRAQSLEVKLNNARAVAEVKMALAQDETLRAFDFQPSIDGDVLTLEGAVKTREQKERAAEVVRGLEGVRTVVNNVRVTDATGPDLSDLPPPRTDTAAAGAARTQAEPQATPEPAPQSEPEPEQIHHTVRSGDTLGAIARRYGVTVRQIQQLNGLRGTNIRVGQRLRVK